MQIEQLQKLDGFGLSDYLRALPATEHRNACDTIADFVSLESWCQMEEPFQTYVAWAIEGEAGTYGNGRDFELEILDEGVSLMQGFDRRGRRRVRIFKKGEIVRLRAGEAKVTFKTYGSVSSMASERGKVRESFVIDEPTKTTPAPVVEPKRGKRR